MDLNCKLIRGHRSWIFPQSQLSVENYVELFVDSMGPALENTVKARIREPPFLGLG